MHYQYNPVKTIKTSVMGTINMLGLAKRVRARILLTSTSEVYGDPEEHPQTESYWGHVNPIGVRSCYDEGKRVAECLMMDYHRQNNVDTRIVRIFNTYGPRMAINDGRVVSNFCVAALRGENLEIYGDGNSTRSFAYVDDIIDAIVRMMNQDDAHRPGEHRQPRRIHHRGTGEARDRARRQLVEGGHQAAAPRRSRAPQTEHRSREKSPRLAAAHRTSSRPRENDRAFREELGIPRQITP